jgi:hypothetical protein
MVVIHHTGDGEGRPTAQAVAAYQTGPTATWPFPRIAYAIFIEGDATIEIGNDLEDECWSNGVGSPTEDANQEGVYNDWTISVCFSGQDPTDQQWSAAMKVYDAVQTVLNRTLQLTGHGLLPNGGTDCPGLVARGKLQPPSL